MVSSLGLSQLGGSGGNQGVDWRGLALVILLILVIEKSFDLLERLPEGFHSATILFHAIRGDSYKPISLFGYPTPIVEWQDVGFRNATTARSNNVC